MKVLVACEFSGIVRDAFKAKGHDAWSCDLLPTEKLGNHIQGDVLEILNDGWDLMIAHPPCTYFSGAGTHYLKTQPARMKLLWESFAFWKELYGSNIDKIAMENPQGWLNTNWKKPSQTIEPYYFGDHERKRTCLWLKNLPLLQYWLSDNFFGEKTAVKKPSPRGSYVAKSGRDIGRIKNYYFCAGKTAKQKSKTFPGIANAMAEQWG